MFYYNQNYYKLSVNFSYIIKQHLTNGDRGFSNAYPVSYYFQVDNKVTKYLLVYSNRYSWETVLLLGLVLPC